MDHIEIIKVLALSWTITTFAPLSWLLELLPNNLFKYILVVLTSCLKCCSLWLGIALYGLWIGITASIIAAVWTDAKQAIQRWIWQKNNKK
jgi:hypothetical protein